MTKEEVIKGLRDILDRYELIGFEDLFGKDIRTINMAIEALENEQPKGHWILRHVETAPKYVIEKFYCSECNEGQIYGMPNYCPNCGADMRNEENE